MTVTEQEASAKWCPHVRLGLNTNDNAMATRYYCIGSVCMMWQWASQPPQRQHMCSDLLATVEPERPAGLPDNWGFQSHVPGGPHGGGAAHWLEPEAEAVKRGRGFCGLATRGPDSLGTDIDAFWNRTRDWMQRQQP